VAWGTCRRCCISTTLPVRVAAATWHLPISSLSTSQNGPSPAAAVRAGGSVSLLAQLPHPCSAISGGVGLLPCGAACRPERPAPLRPICSGPCSRSTEGGRAGAAGWERPMGEAWGPAAVRCGLWASSGAAVLCCPATGAMEPAVGGGALRAPQRVPGASAARPVRPVGQNALLRYG
jgi:hypothetical protein